MPGSNPIIGPLRNRCLGQFKFDSRLGALGEGIGVVIMFWNPRIWQCNCELGVVDLSILETMSGVFMAMTCCQDTRQTSDQPVPLNVIQKKLHNHNNYG